MSRLKQLIDELCPEGVEFVKLGEVCEIKGRIGFRGYTRADLVEKGEGAISLSPSNIVNEQLKFDSCTYVSWEKYEESPEIMVEVGDVIFTKTASVGKTALVKTLPEKATINPQLVVLKNAKCNSAYLSYVLKDSRFQAKVKQKAGVGSVPNISQTNLGSIDLPLPPLSIQSEIVTILDKFTTLEAELEAELDCRKRQYQYYRDKLLNFKENEGLCPEGVEFVKLGEICTFMCSGGTPNTSRQDYYNGSIPWLRTQEVDWCEITDTSVKITEIGLQNSSAKMIPADCIIVAMYGATAAKVAINKIPLCTNQACFNVKIDENIADKRFVYQWLCKNYEVLKAKGEGTQHNINAKKIKDFQIPLPPLPLQQKIADILDRFERLTTDLQEGLPAEIEARRQQYEYYRNKLLTFKRKTT